MISVAAANSRTPWSEMCFRNSAKHARLIDVTRRMPARFTTGGNKKPMSFPRGARFPPALHIVFNQTGSQIAGIRDGCRTADELRLAPIEFRIPAAAAAHCTNGSRRRRGSCAVHPQRCSANSQRAASNAWVRQDSRVQHVRIRQDDVALLADGFARVAGRVSVIVKTQSVLQPLVQIVKFRKLVLRQRLGGKRYSARVSVSPRSHSVWQL